MDEILLHLSCSYYYIDKNIDKAEEFVKQANSKIDVNKVFRQMSDGSDDSRKWLIDEQLLIHKNKKGDKEGIKLNLTAFIDKMKEKFTQNFESFESLVPNSKERKKTTNFTMGTTNICDKWYW